MKRLFILLSILFLFPYSVFAAAPNNIYGIHLAQPYPQDLKAASDLSNSNGGDWGYVTLVIQENDRDRNKWQGIFDNLRELHLIPIIRLATQAEGENWRRPEVADAENWAEFLNSLNWVVKNRYVILFNEPNHGSEWGGEVDVKSYAKVSLEFAKKLKEKNSDFFVMLSGFDASAPSWMPGMEDEEIFLKKTIDQTPDIFNYIDGWASHSYPNPGFVGSPSGFGRGTIRTYQWELDMLRSLGVSKDLPVFVTETGWDREKLGEITTANYFTYAYQNIWSQDSRIWAVTPFVLDYQSAPFLEFSWKKQGDDSYYQQYSQIQSLSKEKGEPQQVEKGAINFNLPHELVAQSSYNFRINLKNQGQAIWDKNDGYELKVTDNGLHTTEFLVEDVKDIKPFEEKTINFSLKTTDQSDMQKIKFILTKNSQVVFESSPWNFQVLPLPSLNFEVDYFPWGKGQGNDFEIQLFDADEKLIFKKKGVVARAGKGTIKDIQNVAINEPYRVVILKPGYLPRQTFLIFTKDNNLVEFRSMLPFDFNHDGKFDWNDILKLLGLLRS